MQSSLHGDRDRDGLGWERDHHHGRDRDRERERARGHATPASTSASPHRGGAKLTVLLDSQLATALVSSTAASKPMPRAATPTSHTHTHTHNHRHGHSHEHGHGHRNGHPSSSSGRSGPPVVARSVSTGNSRAPSAVSSTASSSPSSSSSSSHRSATGSSQASAALRVQATASPRDVAAMTRPHAHTHPRAHPQTCDTATGMLSMPARLPGHREARRGSTPPPPPPRLERAHSASRQGEPRSMGTPTSTASPSTRPGGGGHGYGSGGGNGASFDQDESQDEEDDDEQTEDEDEDTKKSDGTGTMPRSTTAAPSTATAPATTAAKPNGGVSTSGPRASRPVRVKYEQVSRNGKREISQASLGKLMARLTDAHQYDAEFRDVFLLTFPCFCSTYEFVKKLTKRYTAVLMICSGLDAAALQQAQLVMDQITTDEVTDRSTRASMRTVLSSAHSDIHTGVEASVSIMRLLSVLKFWIRESGFIERDLLEDRRAQKKLLTLLTEIQSTTPIASIRQHAEVLFMQVAQLVRYHQQQQIQHQQFQQQQMQQQNLASGIMPTPVMPPPSPSLSPRSMSSSNGSNGVATGSVVSASTTSRLSSAMSKLKITRSSSDSKKDRSSTGKTARSTRLGHVDDLATGVMSSDRSPSSVLMMASASTAPRMQRGVTTGSTEMELTSGGGGGASTLRRGSSNPLEEVIHDTVQRARLTASRSSSRISYDNAQPISGIAAHELADQLTLMETEVHFSRISPRELTNKAWTRENKYRDAPNVMALIEIFDATAEWVSSEILHPQLQAAERAKLIMLFIDAADHCAQLNNFNSLFEITTGLSAPWIRQLSTTWGLVSASAQEKFQLVMQMCSPEDNYRSYRQAFALAEGQPRLPCSFLLVKDLFTLEEANKSIEDGLVNWQKFRKIHKVISEALERQNLNYLPADGSPATGISRRGKGPLHHDRKVQVYLRRRLDIIRKESTVLYQLARNANKEESIMFVNSLSEAGFL